MTKEAEIFPWALVLEPHATCKSCQLFTSVYCFVCCRVFHTELLEVLCHSTLASLLFCLLSGRNFFSSSWFRNVGISHCSETPGWAASLDLLLLWSSLLHCGGKGENGIYDRQPVFCIPPVALSLFMLACILYMLAW